MGACKSTEPKPTKEQNNPPNSFDDFGNPINDPNNLPLGQRLQPQISSSQVVGGVVQVNPGSQLQLNFVIGNVPENANLGVGLTQKPSGAGLTNQGKFPTMIWPFPQESPQPYPVELIVRDVNECLRLGGANNVCWLSEGDQIYTKDTRYDTAFTFSLHVGDNVNGSGATGVKGWWEKLKKFFSRNN